MKTRKTRDEYQIHQFLYGEWEEVIANAELIAALANSSEALVALVKAAGLDLKVAVIEGDDLLARAGDFTQTREMFSGEAFPDPKKILSINAYLGAFPIARALGEGADIVDSDVLVHHVRGFVAQAQFHFSINGRHSHA